MNIFWGFFFGFIFCAMLVLLRDIWVHEYKIKLLNNMSEDNYGLMSKQLEEYENLPGESTMLFQFWKYNYSEYHPSININD